MPKYGYAAYTFEIRPYGRQTEALPIGKIASDQDGLVILYGALRGLAGRGVRVRERYLRTENARGIGRTVRFTVAVGNSGVRSSIIDPGDDEKVVFRRATRHVESSSLRGLVVAPARSKKGLIILEVQSRTSAKNILFPALKRAVRKYTGLVLDFAAVADEGALEAYLRQANIKAINMRREGLPNDIADVVDLAHEDAAVGDLEMRIKPGSLKAFSRRIIEKLRNDRVARNSLLTIGGLDFSELSINVEVGQRKKTLTVDADRVPSFIYDLPGPVPDGTFFSEVLTSVDEIAQAVGVIVSGKWQDGPWSPQAAETTIELPVEDSDDGHQDAEAT